MYPHPVDAGIDRRRSADDATSAVAAVVDQLPGHPPQRAGGRTTGPVLVWGRSHDLVGGGGRLGRSRTRAGGV